MIEGNSFVFNEAQFNRLYPFHFAIDADMKIVAMGNSLTKLLPDNIGNSFHQLFRLKRPGSLGIGFEQLSKYSGLVIIEATSPTNLILRGQFEYFAQPNCLLFLGSPWFKRIEELVEHDLTLNDFATHDPLIDLLHVIKSKEIVTDETMELLQQMQLQKNEFYLAAQRLGQLISNLQTGILLEDENRKIVLTNKTFCNMFLIHHNPETMVGWDCSNAADQSKDMFSNPESFVHRIQVLLKERVLSLGEKLQLVDGRIYERDYIPMFINNIYRGHLWKYTDITDREVQQDNLRKSEEKYRGIITNINLGLIEVDLDENIKYANQSFIYMSGYQEEELIGKNALSLFLGDSYWKEQMINRRFAREKKVSDVYELPVITKNGDEKWWLISGAPLLDDHGEVVGSIGIHLDITRQKNLEQELRIAKIKAEKSSQAKELFLANMSHEIRTPLNGIYGMMQLLQTTEMDAEQESYINSIEMAIESLQNIINDILDFSKINAGMIEIAEQPFSLSEVIDTVSKLASPKASAKKLEITIHFSSDLRKYYLGDPFRLNQIITNLLGNAVKFTERGSVQISCRKLSESKKGDLIEIVVSDTGIGIEKDFLPFIFDKFTQEENGLAIQYGGTGLGMSICKQLVELMHGQITIQSEKNKGTAVSILLSLKEGKAPELIKTSTSTEHSLQGLRILVAEDNEINAMVLKNLLSKEGAIIKLVVNGKEMIEELVQKEYDLVLTDVQMPVMNGIEAVIWIRENYSRSLKIIALTANAFKKEKERCLKAGFDAVVYKPFKKDHLLNICSEQLSLNETPSKLSKKRGKELYDLRELMEMMDQSEDQLKLILSQFVEETPRKISVIRKAIEDNDALNLKTNVHYMASSIHHLKIASLYKPLSKIDRPKFLEIGTKEKELGEQICTTLEMVIEKLKLKYQC